MVNRYDSIQFILTEKWLLHSNLVVTVLWVVALVTQVCDDRPCQLACVLFVVCNVITDARLLGVESGTAKIFRGDNLTSCCLHEWRSTQEDCTFLVHHHDLVTHRWDVRTASSATTEDNRDLWDAFGTHPCLIIKYPAKIVLIGEDVILLRKEGTCRVDHVYAWKVVLLSNLLGPQVLLHRNRVVCSTLECKIVGNNHALSSADHADACDHVSAWHTFFDAE